jgi:hypothetical protein
MLPSFVMLCPSLKDRLSSVTQQTSRPIVTITSDHRRTAGDLSGVLRWDPAWCAIDMIRQSLLWICAEGWCWKHLTWKFDVTRKVEAVVHNLN